MSITRLSLIAPGYPAGSRGATKNLIPGSSYPAMDTFHRRRSPSRRSRCAEIATGAIVGVIHRCLSRYARSLMIAASRCARADNSTRIFNEYTSRTPLNRRIPYAAAVISSSRTRSRQLSTTIAYIARALHRNSPRVSPFLPFFLPRFTSHLVHERARDIKRPRAAALRLTVEINERALTQN